MGNAKELVEEFEREYGEEAQRIKEEDKVFNRGELPGKYTAKLLYGWNNGKFEKKYLKKLERNWRQWNSGLNIPSQVST